MCYNFKTSKAVLIKMLFFSVSVLIIKQAYVNFIISLNFIILTYFISLTHDAEILIEENKIYCLLYKCVSNLASF